MIFHLSIDADHPHHVASVLAELLGGEALPFPPVSQGSWLALARDDRGSSVEVYPRGTELAIAEGDADAVGLPGGNLGGSPTHFAMATDWSLEAVLALAVREDWPAKYRKRGGIFGVIELWIEGRQMIEVLTPDMQAEYRATMTIENWKRFLDAHRPLESA